MRFFVLTLLFAGFGGLCQAVELPRESAAGLEVPVARVSAQATEEIADGQDFPLYKSEQFRDAASGEAIAAEYRSSGFLVLRVGMGRFYCVKYVSATNGRSPPTG